MTNLDIANKANQELDRLWRYAYSFDGEMPMSEEGKLAYEIAKHKNENFGNLLEDLDVKWYDLDYVEFGYNVPNR